MPTARHVRVWQCGVLVAWCLWTAGPVRGQAPASPPGPQTPAAEGQQAPVFRGGVNFVSVDVYPRRDGAVVEGLTATDFQVFEDGKPQKVETFEFVKIDSNPVDSDRRDPNSVAEGDRLAEDPRNRVWVVYLDLAHTTVPGSYYSQRTVVDFLTRTIGANDVFGFMTAEVPAGQLMFGRRTEAIEAQLAKFWSWGQDERLVVTPRTPIEERLTECGLLLGARTGDTGENMTRLLIQLHREDLLHTSLESLVVRLRDLRDERKNILYISEGWVPRGPMEALNNVRLGEGSVPGVGVGPGGRIGIGQSMDPMNTSSREPWCDSMISRLGNQDFDRRFRNLLTQAQQANVSFYPVDVGGLKVNSPLGGPRDTLKTLAENTDGIAVTDTNDLKNGVRRIADDLSRFYLLGYNSTNSATDGRYRRIEVKVAAPRVDVSARRGYLAASAEEMARRSVVPVGPTAVDDELGRLATIREGIDLFIRGTTKPDGLDVVLELSAAAHARAGWQRGVEVRLVATGAGGAATEATATIAAGDRSTRVTIPIDPGAAGPWNVIARATGPEGPVDVRLDVPASAATLAGEPSAWRGTPSPRIPLKPLADVRLTRAERLRVEWPVLQPADTRTARLLDRRGQPLGAALPFATLPPEQQALAVDLPVSALPEGDYVVELVVGRADITERRLLAFRVVR